MMIGITAMLLFLLGLVGVSFSFLIIVKKKKANRKTGASVAVCIVFCLIVVLSAFYLACTMLLIGGID